MREIRLSGSEGGGTEFNRFSLPLSSQIRTAPALWGWSFERGSGVAEVIPRFYTSTSSIRGGGAGILPAQETSPGMAMPVRLRAHTIRGVEVPSEST
jgi:hypothetical protein